MKNELFSIGPITIYGYGLMIAIGVLAAYFSATYRSKKYALDPDKVFYVTVWAVIGGFGGAKLLYLITQLPAILKDPSLLKDARNGFVVYGGIIGGILAAWLYCKVAKLKFIKYFDLVMPSVALAQGFGRIGCFLAGCCYGKETNSAFHILFHDSAYAPNNVPLIPTQLISSGLDFLNCIFLMWFAGKKKGDGQVAVYRYFHCDCRRGTVFLVWKEKGTGTGKEYTGRKGCVTIQQPLSHEVSWHEYAQIPRHTSKNAITEGDF